MTKTDRARLPAALLLLAAFAAGGCAGVPGRTAAARESGQKESARASLRERGDILRESPAGAIIVVYVSAPAVPGAPPDGMRGAVVRAIDASRTPVSAASFHRAERARALRWIRAQMEERRARGLRPRVILAGHGFGATEASETARELLFRERDFAIVLLLTVDAVKTSRYGGAAAYAAGNAIVNSLPGVSHSFTAYDAAPAPDGVSVLAHINYYQNKTTALHGAAMPHAENHLLADWTGVLNHENADDFALPNLVADLKYAIAQAGGGADTTPHEHRAGDPAEDIAGKGGDEFLRGIHSANKERRMTSLRVAAARAGELRRRGDGEGARRLEDVVIRRYFIEREEEVRSCIVRICAPSTGRSAAMVRFLRDRIAAGEFPGYAALSLAAMAPKTACADIEPLTRHPAPDVRLHAAAALAVLGDPRGYAAVSRVWRAMEPGLWPEEFEGVTRGEARDSLAARARRAFGKELR